MRKRARTDGNQEQIVRELRKLGATVAITSQLGGGFPDLAVGFRGKTFLLEVKDPSQIPSKRRLTTDERAWHGAWSGHVAVVETLEDALQEIEK